ncbi:MAG: hypothetical protein L6455_13175 [Kiritimatiellae bacterium]|nr:hypothetical protein [Kiritimatiellia bacterium]
MKKMLEYKIIEGGNCRVNVRGDDRTWVLFFSDSQEWISDGNWTNDEVEIARVLARRAFAAVND